MSRKMHDYHVNDLMTCVRERIKKDEVITQTKLARVCEIDSGTVKNHFQSIVNKDLGDGTKILSREKCYTEYYRDPPEEPYLSWPIVSLVFVTAVIIRIAVTLAAQGLGTHSHAFNPVPVLDPSAFVPVLSGWTYSSTV